jgi:hypothetical protein
MNCTASAMDWIRSLSRMVVVMGLGYRKKWRAGRSAGSL